MIKNLSKKLFIFISLFIIIKCVDIEFDVIQIPKYYTPFNEDVYLSGSFNNWSPNSYKLNRISSNIYRINLNLPLGTYEYKFTRGTWSSVETNSNGDNIPNRILNVNSATKQTHLIKILNWNDYVGNHTSVGNVHIIHSKFPYPQFNTTKRIWIYLPKDYYTSIKSYSVLYMHDGHNLFDQMYTLYSFTGEWEIDETMEKFFDQGKQTSIVVGLETRNERRNELTPYPNENNEGGQGDKYVDFIIKNLKPYIDSNFKTKPQREYTAILGSSHGGLMSFYAGLKNQNVFSKIGSFSPSFWFSNKIFDLVKLNDINKYDDTKLYFVCGELESAYPSLVSDMIKMIDLLKLYNYTNIEYVVREDGKHSEWFWKREFPIAYNWLFQN